MEYPKDQVELENIIHQCKDEGDERGEMLGLFASAVVEDSERSRMALKTNVDEVRNMLDHIESWHASGWVAEADVKRVRDLVNGLLYGEGDLKLQVQEADEKSLTLGFKSHWAVRINAYALKDMLKRPDGTFWNFIEMKMTDREIGDLLVTLQRRSGETPRDQITKLEDQVKMLEGVVSFAQAERKELLAKFEMSKSDREKTLETELEAEKSDLAMICHEVSVVYDHVTGGLASKPTTMAHEIIALHDQRQQEAVDEATKELEEVLKQFEGTIPSKPVCPSCRGTGEIDVGVCSQPGCNGFHKCGACQS